MLDVEFLAVKVGEMRESVSEAAALVVCALVTNCH